MQEPPGVSKPSYPDRRGEGLRSPVCISAAIWNARAWRMGAGRDVCLVQPREPGPGFTQGVPSSLTDFFAWELSDMHAAHQRWKRTTVPRESDCPRGRLSSSRTSP